MQRMFSMDEVNSPHEVTKVWVSLHLEIWTSSSRCWLDREQILMLIIRVLTSSFNLFETPITTSVSFSFSFSKTGLEVWIQIVCLHRAFLFSRLSVRDWAAAIDTPSPLKQSSNRGLYWYFSSPSKSSKAVGAIIWSLSIATENPSLATRPLSQVSFRGMSASSEVPKFQELELPLGRQWRNRCHWCKVAKEFEFEE